MCWRCRVSFHLVLSARDFLALDLQAGFSRWRLARREKLLEDQLSFPVPTFVCRPLLRVRMSGAMCAGPIVSSKRRRMARLAQSVRPGVSLAPPFFRAACGRLGYHCSWVLEQTIVFVIEAGARLPGSVVD